MKGVADISLLTDDESSEKSVPMQQGAYAGTD
jgi:hypothetical protein